MAFLTGIQGDCTIAGSRCRNPRRITRRTRWCLAQAARRELGTVILRRDQLPGMFQPLTNLPYPLADQAAIEGKLRIPFDGKDFAVLDMHQGTGMARSFIFEVRNGFLVWSLALRSFYCIHQPNEENNCICNQQNGAPVSHPYPPYLLRTNGFSHGDHQQA